MTYRLQRDGLALLGLTMHDAAVDSRVFHGPRESRSGGSGVIDTRLRHASTGREHANTCEHGILRKSGAS
jgi:hypothetical protein